MVDDKKESTIYTHYGTIPTSERRDHKAAQGRVRPCRVLSACDGATRARARACTHARHARTNNAALGHEQARACHHFFLRHEACVNRHLRFGKEAVVSGACGRGRCVL